MKYGNKEKDSDVRRDVISGERRKMRETKEKNDGKRR
jgi:hypothetical protein